LLILLILLYMFVISNRQLQGVMFNNKLFNTSYSSKFLFIQTLLFFLWSSAISMLCLFWSCVNLCTNCIGLDVTVIELFYHFSLISHSGISFFSLYTSLFVFFFAVLLKSSIIPLQAWLVIFYKHLPLPALFSYLSFYYVYFIFTIFTLFFGYLYPFAVIWLYGISLLVMTGIIFAIFNISEAFTFRNFIAYSSIINLFFLFIFLVTNLTFAEFAVFSF
jgi:hypothetical protein